MNKEQKMALSLVISTLFAFAISCTAVVILYYKTGMPRALLGFAFMSLSGLGGFSYFFFKKEKAKVLFDERDQMIREKASLASFMAAYLFVGAACMIPYFVFGPDSSISVKWLPNIFIGALISNFFVYSLVILERYGWRNKS